MEETMNERRELPVVGIGGTNRLNPRGAQEAAARASSVAPPGASLRDPAYHDICAFFGRYPDGQAWQPATGDWVWWPAGGDVRLVVDVESPPSGEQPGGAATHLQIMARRPVDAVSVKAEECVWLPTLDQLRTLLHDTYGSVGFFTSVYTGRTYWYKGELAGMQVEDMMPLSEGRSPEEAAVKALLMRFQR
jgi:hypothetical protein